MANFIWTTVLRGYLNFDFDRSVIKKNVVSDADEIRALLEKYGVNNYDKQYIKLYDLFWQMGKELIDIILSMGCDLTKGKRNLYWPGWDKRGLSILRSILKYDVNYTYIKHSIQGSYYKPDRYVNVIALIEKCLLLYDRKSGEMYDGIMEAYNMLLEHKYKEYKEKTFFSYMYDRLKGKLHIRSIRSRC